MSRNTLGFSTRAIHAGQPPAPGNGAIMTPIYQTSTYVQESPGVHQGYDYARTGNPTRTALEENIASLEGGEFGICFSSGCSATDAVVHLLNTGDHIVSADDVYGGTYRLFTNVYGQMGIQSTFADLTQPDGFARAVKPNTKLLWLESPTNPLLRILDLAALAREARDRGILVVVDNTFASPFLQQPLELGADVVVHSSTKYLGGHSDVIGGVAVTSNRALADRLHYLQNAVGAVPAPLDCFLLLRSTKTLAVRMERHCRNALTIATELEKRKDIERVTYPGLPSHPQFALAQKQMRAPGGMITMVLTGGIERSRRFLERVRLFSLAESLGGVESLIEHPAIMTHASIPKESRESRGISDGLVRLSVGIEDAEDLLADLVRALDESR